MKTAGNLPKWVENTVGKGGKEKLLVSPFPKDKFWTLPK